MIIDLSGKSLQEVVNHLKNKGYVPCMDDVDSITCPCGGGGDEVADECYIHDIYDISIFHCDDFDCDIVFYEILPSDFDKLPDKWQTNDGIMKGLL